MKKMILSALLLTAACASVNIYCMDETEKKNSRHHRYPKNKKKRNKKRRKKAQHTISDGELGAWSPSSDELGLVRNDNESARLWEKRLTKIRKSAFLFTSAQMLAAQVICHQGISSYNVGALAEVREIRENADFDQNTLDALQTEMADNGDLFGALHALYEVQLELGESASDDFGFGGGTSGSGSGSDKLELADVFGDLS